MIYRLKRRVKTDPSLVKWAREVVDGPGNHSGLVPGVEFGCTVGLSFEGIDESKNS